MIATKKKARPKKSARAKKMELKRLIIEQYNLPFLDCNRFGKSKYPSRIDILAGLLWTVFARYIRRRDAGKCISCNDKKVYEQLQAGHYAPVKGSPLELIFSEVNVNGECMKCNADFEGWHLIPMRHNLVSKWGENAVLDIEKSRKAFEKTKKQAVWSETDYVQKINYYYNQINK